MHFNLFYIQYDFKPNLAAIKQFKEATGKDLWASLIRYMSVYMVWSKEGGSVFDLLTKLADEMDFVDSAQLFYCLAKQENGSLTLSEIEDAMYHAGIIENTKDSDMCEPYPIVLYKVALDIHKYHQDLSEEKKPTAHS